jgi:hypothetical protein
MNEPAPVPEVESGAHGRYIQTMRLVDSRFVRVALQARCLVDVSALIDKVDSIAGHNPSTKVAIPGVDLSVLIRLSAAFGCR